MSIERLTMTVEACAICDAGRDWRDIPDEPCGHDGRQHREIRKIDAVTFSDYEVVEAERDAKQAAITKAINLIEEDGDLRAARLVLHRAEENSDG